MFTGYQARKLELMKPRMLKIYRAQLESQKAEKFRNYRAQKLESQKARQLAKLKNTDDRRECWYLELDLQKAKELDNWEA